MPKNIRKYISELARGVLRKVVLFVNSALPDSVKAEVPHTAKPHKTASKRGAAGRRPVAKPRPSGDKVTMPTRRPSEIKPQKEEAFAKNTYPTEKPDRIPADDLRPSAAPRDGRHARPPQGARTRMDLPFMKRRQDAGSWIYQHRTAVCVTLVCYLVLSICFVTSKIVLDRQQTNSTILVDLTDLEKLQEELERAQELNRLLNEQQQYDYDDVGNRISNAEGSESDQQFNRNSSMSEIYDRAEQVQGRVRANRENYERGLREQQEMMDSRNKGEEKSESKSETGKAKGKVTVSYSLSNPLRNAENLYVPAYRCEGGGEVVVKIAVDRNGDVVEAEVDTSQSSSDYCMTTTAVEAARRSRFDVNMSAPTKQYGTISYVFIPQ